MHTTRAGSAFLLSLACAAGPACTSAEARAPGPGEPAAGAGAPRRTHGLAIPAAHPRIWFDAGRLAAARAWYRKNSFTPSRLSQDTLAVDAALRGLLHVDDPGDQQKHCRGVLEWAMRETAGMAAQAEGGSSQWNAARWNGEAIVLAFDWCHAFLSPGERAAFVRDTNRWVEARRRMPYGGPPMYLNNYYWGFTRNQIEWAIASYDENEEAAEAFLEDALERRIRGDFEAGALKDGRGGVLQEGSQYGPYMASYAVVPAVTAGLLGRDLLGETGFWREAVYALVYSMPPGPTDGLGWTFFPHCDAGNGLAHSVAGRDAGHFMTAAAMRWPQAAVGQHARRFLELARPPRARFVEAVDPGGASRPFAGLPLDYWAPGARYAFGRTGWDPKATAVFLQLGDRDVDHVGHAHSDWGTWQIWRKGRFVARETAGYLGNPKHRIAGYANGPPTDPLLAVGHNGILVNGEGSATSPARQHADATVPRLASRPAYLFAVADLTATAKNPRNGNRDLASWVREFVFVRSLETLVVLDRIESTSASATKTFLAHCETKPSVGAGTATCNDGSQALVMTTLVPPVSTHRVVNEGGAVGQYRIEVDTAPGTAQSYVLTVLQAKDGGAPALSPSVADGPDSLVLTLDRSTRIAFRKGMASSGGSFTSGEGTAPFPEGVQAIEVGDDGPSWK